MTPRSIVDNMQYLAREFNTRPIAGKHIMDNSCGDGAFLCFAVETVIDEMAAAGNTQEEIASTLEATIHGIEIDEKLAERCIDNLNNLLVNKGITPALKWDIRNEDALSVRDYDGKMDYVIGNPPYIRTRDLGISLDIIKNSDAMCFGNTDMYLAFISIGLRMLNENGVLCYIIPHNWLTSKSATRLRAYVAKNNLLRAVWDISGEEVFEDASVRVNISVFGKNPMFGGGEQTGIMRADSVRDFEFLSVDEYNINGKFYFENKDMLERLRRYSEPSDKKVVTARCGFATLADNVFIGDHLKRKMLRTIDVFKATTGKRTKCVFPYKLNEEGNLVLCPFCSLDIDTQDYLLENEENLIARDLRDKTEWYEFGRSQGLKDVFKKKFAVNSVIKDGDSIVVTEVDEGEGVYGGIYLIPEPKFAKKVTKERLESLLRSGGFLSYVKSLSNKISGGYYTFTGKDLERFVNHCWLN